jgi:hypothetical protein
MKKKLFFLSSLFLITYTFVSLCVPLRYFEIYNRRTNIYFSFFVYTDEVGFVDNYAFNGLSPFCHISLYLNPFGDQFYIKKLAYFDIYGREVLIRDIGWYGCPLGGRCVIPLIDEIFLIAQPL